jgi:hypothetical protein
MKKLYYLFAIISITISSCGSDDDSMPVDLDPALVGEWSGYYFGDDSGAAQIFVVSDGEFTGLIDGLYELRGNVSENGSLSGSFSESDYSLEWDGILETDGTGSGSWSSNLSGTGYSGDWEVVKD